MTTDEQVEILWSACWGLLPPWAQELKRPAIFPIMRTDKLIPERDKKLAEKLVSIGVSRGGLWSRCISVRAIVEADSECYISTIGDAIARLEDISNRDGGIKWREAKEMLGADLFLVLKGLQDSLAE